MSTKVQLSDEALKGAIINHWKGLGIAITDQTSNDMVKEVRGKMKEGTDDELRLALSELKMDLTPDDPTISSSNRLIVTAESVIKNYALGSYVLKNASLEGMSRDEVSRLISDLSAMASANGRTMKEQRTWISAEIHRLQKRIKRISDEMANLSNFDESDESAKAEILQLIDSSPELQQATQKEHVATPYKMVTNKDGKTLPQAAYKLKGENVSEAAKLQYDAKEIEIINNAFEGKNSGVIRQMDDVNPDKRKGAEKGATRTTNKILWTRRRFAWEKALGNEDTPLYQARKGLYQSYVKAKQKEATKLKLNIDSLDRIRLVTKKQGNIEEKNLTGIREHFHGAANKDHVEALDNRILSYETTLKEDKNRYASNLEKYGKDKQELEEVEAQLEQLMQATEFAPSESGQEALDFDPEFLHGLDRTPSSAEGLSAWQRQKAKIGPNVWGINPDGTLSTEAAPGTETTWQKGQALYQKFDQPSKQTEMDVNTILTYRDAPKITQKFKVGPYAKDADIQRFIERLEKNSTKGWGADLKKKVANTAANWDILYNLSKKNISKEDQSKALGLDSNMKTNTQEEVAMDTIFRQMPGVNDTEVRTLVAGNENTPDWILMFMAENDPDVQTKAISELEKPSRGWTYNKDENGDPVTTSGEGDGNWIWTKKKGKGATSSVSLSYREHKAGAFSYRESAEQNSMQPLLDEQAEIAQERNELVNKERISPDQDFTQERNSLRQRENQVQDKINTSYTNQLEDGPNAMGQQPQGSQGATDVTTAPTPKIPPAPVIPIPAPQAPVGATASKTWGNMFRK
jgi:hypothetical protein